MVTDTKPASITATVTAYEGTNGPRDWAGYVAAPRVEREPAMKGVTRYTDSDRVRLGRRHPIDAVIVGPIEAQRCHEHDAIETYRWVWAADDGPQNGRGEYVRECPDCIRDRDLEIADDDS